MSSLGIRIKELRNLHGLSQDELAHGVNLTKSTISQWELGKAYPKRKNIIQLSDFFDTTVEYLEHGIRTESELKEKESDDSEYCDEIKTIPFYHHVNAAAGSGVRNSNESHRFIHIKELPCLNVQSLFCITASGDSMEPVIKHGSLLVIDSSQTNIVDGKMYVFQQDDFLRVKIFSYEKNQIRVSSYNKEYGDEIYRFDELTNLKIIGKVVWFSTRID
ncbi:helix-turn-helix transcriptional regulator [Vibrio parahaemolyticus]|nr:helix-turn-helix transcriptional regulator [Vibrio parahaemolyticus]ELB2132076.1 helix-turn-helix transcriptional regulator [Vibrio parahaemolyticus]ELB2146989.1 helix-turn-helix transcriptional regulator [Vibrio parahaemolyticus]ELB2239379.1 helix-turn-helix transcriptional regulator [Vibrio parahaemolyticus]